MRSLVSQILKRRGDTLYNNVIYLQPGSLFWENDFTISHRLNRFNMLLKSIEHDYAEEFSAGQARILSGSKGALLLVTDDFLDAAKTAVEARFKHYVPRGGGAQSQTSDPERKVKLCIENISTFEYTTIYDRVCFGNFVHPDSRYAKMPENRARRRVKLRNVGDNYLKAKKQNIEFIRKAIDELEQKNPSLDATGPSL